MRCCPLPIPHGRQLQRVSGVDPNAVVISENVAENDRFNLLAHFKRADLVGQLEGKPDSLHAVVSVVRMLLEYFLADCIMKMGSAENSA